MSFRTFMFLFCIFVISTVPTPLTAGQLVNFNEFVERCLCDFDLIKPGMAREEVEKKFPRDGGIQSVSPVRFIHPKCSYFKVDVEFEFQRIAKDQGRAIIGKRDKVIRASKPYLERAFLD
jgi:hypothetical protein